MSFDFHQQTALITGANRGIGKAIAEALLDAGAARVYAGVRDVATAKPLADAYPGRVLAIALDLTQPDTITAAASHASDVSLVVNNAGVLKVASPLDAHAVESMRNEVDVNVFGLIRMARAFAPVLKANGGGAFVQLNSVASLKSFADFATYAASKAASYSITQALREKLADQGTRVVSVHPGPIQTDMADDAGFEGSPPPRVVGDALVAALKADDFHVWPDPMAEQFADAYRSYAQAMIEG